MVASGPRSGTTFAVKTAYYNGFYGWTNTANLAASDNSYASSSSSLSTADTDALSSVGFGFAIPSTATIIGVICEIECKGSSSRIQGIRLENAGVGIGSQKSPSTSLPGSDAYLSFGSASDMWGMSTATLTPAVVNSSTFGFWFYVAGTQGSAGVCTVDHVRVTVHYLPVPTAASVSASYGSYNATGPNNTPWQVQFTGGGGLTNYQVRTANTPTGGTQVITGAAADGAQLKSIAYNAAGLAQAYGMWLYLFVSNDSGVTWSTSYQFQFNRDDSIVAPSAISHSPNPVGASKQYTVTFNLLDTYTLDSFAMYYRVYTGAGGTGTLLQQGNFSQGNGVVTATITDSTITNGATRYLRCNDGAQNYAETAFTVAYNPSISGTSRLVLPFPVMSGAGKQAIKTDTVLTLPSPIISAAGRQDIEATSRLILPFPVVSAGGTQRVPVTYPTNAVSLDDFTGADTGSINGRVATPSARTWITPMPGASDIITPQNPLGIFSNTVGGTVPFEWSSAIVSGENNRTSAPVEYDVTIGANFATICLAWLVTTPGPGTTRGYLIAFNSGVINLYRWHDGSLVGLQSNPITLAEGDKVGIRHDPDGTIHILANNGAFWYEVSTFLDNTFFVGQFALIVTWTGRADNLNGTPASLIPTGTSRLVLPFPTISAVGKQRLVSTSRLVLPSPLLVSSGRQDIAAQSRLILPTPVVSAAGKQKVISTSRLILPSPVMKTQGLQKDTGVARLITPFPVMFSSGLHTDIQAVSSLIIPFPVLKTTGAVTFLWDYPYDTFGYGARPYDSWPGQVALVNPADATLTLPFPMMLAAGRQRIFDTGSILVSPFPVLATNGRQAIKAATVLTVPNPVMAATGHESRLGVSRLVLPSPVMYSTGTHTDIQGTSRLVLPFPILRAIGAFQGGARAYLILPSPVMRANGIQKDIATGRLILPFPIVSGLGRQDIAAQSRLISPFPVMVSTGRGVFKGQARLILPSPLMHSTGRSVYKGQSILTAPFPIIISTGLQTYRAQARLVLPFPILQAVGFAQSPPGLSYNPVIQLEQYTGLLIIESYDGELILSEYSGALEIPDYSAYTSIPTESEARSY